MAVGWLETGRWFLITTAELVVLFLALSFLLLLNRTRPGGAFEERYALWPHDGFPVRLTSLGPGGARRARLSDRRRGDGRLRRADLSGLDPYRRAAGQAGSR